MQDLYREVILCVLLWFLYIMFRFDCLKSNQYDSQSIFSFVVVQ